MANRLFKYFKYTQEVHSDESWEDIKVEKAS